MWRVIVVHHNNDGSENAVGDEKVFFDKDVRSWDSCADIHFAQRLYCCFDDNCLKNNCYKKKKSVEQLLMISVNIVVCPLGSH